MPNWYASVEAKDGKPPTTLIIGADVAHDAKQYAMRVLGAEGLLFQETGADATADVELRWAGDDYNAGGKPGGRRLQMRKRGKRGWGEWRELT